MCNNTNSCPALSAPQMYNDKKPATGVAYHISGMGVDRDPKGVFIINEDTGVVYAQKSVDREKYSLFEVSDVWRLLHFLKPLQIILTSAPLTTDPI